MVIVPRLQIEEPVEDKVPEASTADDYQPKVRDVNKRWKRARRWRNRLTGALMLLVTVAVALPYVLAAAGVDGSKLLFGYIPEQFDAVGNIIYAVKTSISLDWTGDAVARLWIQCVPSLILATGILGIAINLIKSLLGVFGVIKPKKYIAGAVWYLIAVIVILVLSLLGSETLGVERIDFVADFIYGYKSSELFSLIVFAAGNAAAAVLAEKINPERTGYTR